MKKIVLLVGIVLVLFLGWGFYLNSQNKNNDDAFPTPTLFKPEEGGNAESGVEVDTDPTGIEIDRRSSLVSALIEKAPFTGKNFSFYFSFENNMFTVYINPKNQQLGEKEFTDFLKQNGVDDKSWIENLTTTSSPVTPAP